jgi:WD40 repeat protein
VQASAAHSSLIVALAYHPLQPLLASAGKDGVVRLWKLTQGQFSLQREWKNLPSAPIHLLFTPDGKQLVVGFTDASLRLWQVDTGALKQTLSGLTPTLLHMDVSSNGRLLALATGGESIPLWNLQNNSLERTLTLKGNKVRRVRFSPNGRWLVVVTASGRIQVQDIQRDVQVSSINGHSLKVTSLAFNPSGSLLVTASEDRTAKLWELQKGTLLKAFPGHQKAVTGVSIDPLDQTLATSSLDGTVRLWELSTGKLTKTLQHSSAVLHVCFDNDATWLVTATSNRTLQSWDLQKARVAGVTGHGSRIRLMAFQSRQPQMLASSNDTSALLWDLKTGALLWSLQGHREGISAIAMSADGTLAATASFDKTIRLWDLTRRQQTKVLFPGVKAGSVGKKCSQHSDCDASRFCVQEQCKAIDSGAGHTEPVLAMAFSNDGKTLISGSRDRTVRFWSVQKGTLLKTILAHDKPVQSLALSAKGVLATGSDNGLVKLWDTTSFKSVKTLRGSGFAVYALAFHPKENRLAVAGNRNEIVVWSTDKAQIQSRFSLPAGQTIYQLSYSQDGSLLSGAGTVWNSNSGKVVGTFATQRQSWLGPLPYWLVSADPFGGWFSWKVTTP